MQALYLSLDHTTAYLEASQGFREKPEPLTFVAYEVDCVDIIDLSDEESRSTWNVSTDDLECTWEMLAGEGHSVPTWQLAERLRAAGQAGIIVRSFASGATAANLNLVLRTWGDELPHRVKVIDTDGRLPRDDSSWRPSP